MDARQRTVPGGVGGLCCERVAAVIVRAESGGILPVKDFARVADENAAGEAHGNILRCGGPFGKALGHAYLMPVDDGSCPLDRISAKQTNCAWRFPEF